MTTQLRNFEGTWVLQRAGRGGRSEFSATAQTQSDTLVIEVPSLLDGVVLRLRPNGEAMSGTFVMGSQEPTGASEPSPVRVTIEENGRILLAEPEGFANLEQWIMRRP